MHKRTYFLFVTDSENVIWSRQPKKKQDWDRDRERGREKESKVLYCIDKEPAGESEQIVRAKEDWSKSLN